MGILRKFHWFLVKTISQSIMNFSSNIFQMLAYNFKRLVIRKKNVKFVLFPDPLLHIIRNKQKDFTAMIYYNMLMSSKCFMRPNNGCLII